MKKKIYAESAIAENLREFFNTEKINIEVTSEQADNIKIVKCNDRRESDINTIYAGGSISCETARKIASLTGIPLNTMGKLMNHLDVKIRRCSLGCFK
ncbi:MAG: hypothetical protein JW787_12825 [Sedimentisphaerales bacterium]|nr:hypothetical protein [Sedimentisphaerales bacterium]